VGLKSQELRPCLIIVDKKGRSSPCRTSAKCVISSPMERHSLVEDGAEVRAGDVLARIPTEAPRRATLRAACRAVAELFEARKPKEAAVLAELDGFVEFARTTRTSVASSSSEERQDRSDEYLSQGKHISVREGITSRRAITSSKAILRRTTFCASRVEELATYLVKEIQDVFVCRA